jgi:hypothetical protein
LPGWSKIGGQNRPARYPCEAAASQFGPAFRWHDRRSGCFGTASLYHTGDKTRVNLLNKSSRIARRLDASPNPSSTYERQEKYVRLNLE